MGYCNSRSSQYAAEYSNIVVSIYPLVGETVYLPGEGGELVDMEMDDTDDAPLDAMKHDS
jgi:hypothetical protein